MAIKLLPLEAVEETGKSNTPHEIKIIPYQNATLSPYMLVQAAIHENKRYKGMDALPKHIYVSDDLLAQIAKDMSICTQEEFNGVSIPFAELVGKKAYILISSAKKVHGYSLPRDLVWCDN